jgi:hypothetical protein
MFSVDVFQNTSRELHAVSLRIDWQFVRIPRYIKKRGVASIKSNAGNPTRVRLCYQLLTPDDAFLPCVSSRLGSVYQV